MYTKKTNLHIHTYYSDGAYTPRHILKTAKKLGFDIIAITDHNEIRGTLAAFDIAPEYEMVAYLGAELYFYSKGKLSELLVYFSEKKDLVAFFNQFRRTKHFVPKYNSIDELTSLVYQHNGVCVAPHPCAHKGLIGHGEEGDFIGIETANSFISSSDNKKALSYTVKNPDKYLTFGGGDMHIFSLSLTVAYTELSSIEEINFDNLWANLQGKKKTIRFKAIGGSLSLSKRIIQELWCLIKASSYIIVQDYHFRKLHNFHNFKKHHREN